MISSHDIASLIGRHVVDEEGHKVGTVGQVFVDPTTGDPNWVTVKTGLFGSSESFVPLEQAAEVEGELRIPYGKDAVKHAPRFDSDAELTHRQEEELYAYYALRDAPDSRADEEGGARHHGRHAQDDTHDREGDGGDRDREDVATRSPADDDDDAVATTGTSGTSGTSRTSGAVEGTDGTATPTPVAGSGLRLRRYVVTEQVTVTVPVTREEVRLEPESPAGSASEDGADTPPTSR